MPGLGTSLKEQQTLLLGVVLALLRADPAHLAIILLSLGLALLHRLAALLLVFHEIELVPHQRDDNPRARLPLQLGDPVLGLDQAAGFGDVVDDERALRIAVVHGRQAGEALLARRVPDFEFDRAVGQVAFLRQEGGADCGLFVGFEGVVDEAEDEGGLWRSVWLVMYVGLAAREMGIAYLSYGCFAEEDQLDAAAGLGRVGCW
jgi:hypothetical protein